MRKISFLILILLVLNAITTYSQNCFDYINQIDSLKEKGNIKEAAKMADIAIAICKLDETIENARALYRIADTYELCGRYTDAEKLYLKAIEIQKKSWGENHLEYANLLNSMGLISKQLGNYSKAEDYYLKGLSICKSIGRLDTLYATILNDIADLFQSTDNYDKAEIFYKNAIHICDSILGKEHEDYIGTLNNLAFNYKQQGDYLKAETNYLQGLMLCRKALPKDHIYYSVLLDNIGVLYYTMGKYQIAEKYCMEAIEIRKQTLGTLHPHYANSLEHLGRLYELMGKWQKSEYYYMETLRIRSKILVPQNSKYIISLINLGNLLCSQGYYAEADELYIEAIQIESSVWKEIFSFMSNKECEAFISKNLYKYYLWNTLQWQNKLKSNLPSSLYNFTILMKGSLLQNNNVFTNQLTTVVDSTTNKLKEEYRNIKQEISTQYQLPRSRQQNIRSLELKSDELEKEIMRRIPSFREAILNSKNTWKDIKGGLKQGEAAIEFLQFKYFNTSWSDNYSYSALILRPEWDEPKYVPLFRSNQLDSILPMTSSMSAINNFYRNMPGEGITIIDSASSAKMYHLIWQPLDTLLIGVKTIYLSPVGMLHRISFAAISDTTGKCLLEKYDLNQVSNTRSLAETKSKLQESSQIVLMGGVDYENEPGINFNGSVDFIKDSSLAYLRAIRDGGWPFLTWTLHEINSIDSLLKQLPYQVSKYQGSLATEEIIKKLGSGKTIVPKVIHIATHGFSFPIAEETNYSDKNMKNEVNTVFKQSYDPLTRSGIILAGANKAWTKGSTYQNKEDGILTAREISNLNLSGCELVVLSACETGLGEIKGSEGVFGLQRAFKMAGVKYIMVSLWQIPDKETSEFMGIFYDNWLVKKMPIREAFLQTQLFMKNDRKYAPFQWAAFQLTGD